MRKIFRKIIKKTYVYIINFIYTQNVNIVLKEMLNNKKTLISFNLLCILII